MWNNEDDRGYGQRSNGVHKKSKRKRKKKGVEEKAWRRSKFKFGYKRRKYTWDG